MTPRGQTTGVTAFDAVRWHNPPPMVSALALPSGPKLVKIDPLDCRPRSWEAEIDPAPDHLLMWRRGARSAVEVAIGDHRRVADARRRCNGFMIPAGMPSSWAGRAMEPSLALHIHIPDGWLQRLVEEGGSPGRPPSFRPLIGLKDRRVQMVLDGILDAWHNDDPPLTALLEHWVLLLGCALMQGPSPQRVYSLDGSAIARVRAYLADNLHRDIGLADLAMVVEMPVRSFVAAFQRATGETPQAALTRMRLERATTLIAAASLPPEDVALLSGFRDARHLRKILGKSRPPALGLTR